MLKILRRIVQEINTANDFAEALQILVTRVRDAVLTHACTVFLMDHDSQELVLMATDGLNPALVGQLRMKLDQGLVGLIAKKEEPINLENAPDHPQYITYPEVGEERYKALLGVPIIHHRRLYGVLIVQQEEERRFDESEESFLITISAQLAGVIAHAEATGAAALLFHTKTNHVVKTDICLAGTPGSPGVGLGQAVVVYPPADLDAVPDRVAENIETEIQIFQQALAAARNEIKAMAERMQNSLPKEELALFDVYLGILDISGLGGEIIEEIKTGNWAQGALRTVVKRHLRQFDTMEDSYLKERASDIHDLARRVLAYLQEEQQPILEYPEHTILVGEEVTAAALADVPEDRLMGIVSSKGSNNSHVAILARALGVPVVMGVEGVSFTHYSIEGKEVIVDGYYGQVYLSPSPELRQEFLILAEEERQLDISLAELHGKPAVTIDGHMVALFVNTGMAGDAGLALSVGAGGVGLYRTEIAFMLLDRFPAEDEQRGIYRQLLKAFAPRPVIMRTLDIGGDKPLPYFPIVEDNPYLGWRGIRMTLDHPDVFLVQMRAMLRASEGFDNLRIMFPMVTSLNELNDALALFEKAYAEVIEEGAVIHKPLIGVMIEVPSAVYCIRALAKRVDFLSIGTNDLTQYILAVDRTNPRVASLYDALHPAVLRALMMVIEGCRSEGKQVSICGEMANDPAAVILLLAMGFNALSMNSVSLPRVKWVIRSISMSRAKALLEDVLTMDDPNMIRYHLEHALDEAGLGKLIRTGKWSAEN